MARDYYELLQIEAVATADEIHSAYRALAMRYHPDRNKTPEAAAIMAAINEAYSVIGEPSRRQSYDQQRSKAGKSDIADPVLLGARDVLLRQGWIATQSDGVSIILEKDRRAVRVSLVQRLDNASLKKMGRQFAGFIVVLAVEIETPINLALNTVVIDLIHSRQHGAPFPDEMYKALFAPFLS